MNVHLDLEKHLEEFIKNLIFTQIFVFMVRHWEMVTGSLL